MKYLLRGPLRILAAIVIAGISIPAIWGGLLLLSERASVPMLPEVLGATALIIGLLVAINEYYRSLATMKFGNLAGLVLNGLAALLLIAGAVWNGVHNTPDAMNGFLIAALVYPVGLAVVFLAAAFQAMFKKRRARWTGHTA